MQDANCDSRHFYIDVVIQSCPHGTPQPAEGRFFN